MKSLISAFVLILFSAGSLVAQERDSVHLNTYLIERLIPNAGTLTDADLKEISKKSCSVLKTMDSTKIKWIQSYIEDNKIYCVYKAENEDLLKVHAKKGGFPITTISKVSNIIGPQTANN